MTSRPLTVPVICPVCNRTFFRLTKKRKGRGYDGHYFRPLNCVTCSTKCSRVYSYRKR